MSVSLCEITTNLITGFAISHELVSASNTTRFGRHRTGSQLVSSPISCKFSFLQDSLLFVAP
jgi:hypothetical protein